MQTLRQYIVYGFPIHKKSLPQILGKYWDVRSGLHISGRLILFNHRILIPTSLRKEILDILHESHIGITKTRLRASEIIYWPGMSLDIEA